MKAADICDWVLKKQECIDGCKAHPQLNQETIPMSYCKQNTTIPEIQEYSESNLDRRTPHSKNNFHETFVNKYYASMRKMEE
jgi:hypothetical protein